MPYNLGYIQRVSVRSPIPLFELLFDSVRNAVEARGNFVARGVIAGNLQQRWYGASRNCNVGDDGRAFLCHSPQCSLCRIVKFSFEMTHSTKKPGWGRLGSGIYTSSTSSKFVGHSLIATIVLIPLVCRPNDYGMNLVPSPWKVVLLSCVVVGRSKKLATDQPTLTQPPTEFDSVRSKSSSSEIFGDCCVGHWPAQPHRFSELGRTHRLYQRRCASGLPRDI